MAVGRGRVFVRGSRLWLDYDDEAGKRRRQSTGLEVGQEREAEAMLRALLAQLEAGKELGIDPKTVTVKQWAALWLEAREARDLSMAGEDRKRLERYIYPKLGDVRLADLRPRRVRLFVAGLSSLPSNRGGTLAPRTVRHIATTLRQLLRGAVREELIPSSPFVLDREDLPEVMDKDPAWRAGAVFTRAELELLISHPDIPLHRRVAYAILGLGGLRWGELAALQWRSYDTTPKPLGRLTVAQAVSRKRKKTKLGRTKTGATRLVPVHPTLAKILATWRLEGWPAEYGRAPEGEDLLLPSSDDLAKHRSGIRALRRLHEDLVRLGLPRRRLHDLRRTMISIAQDDGAVRDVLREITHTKKKSDIVADYTSLRWETLCRAVSCIRIAVRERQVVEIRAAAGGGGSGTVLSHRPILTLRDIKKPRKNRSLRGSVLVGETGFEPDREAPDGDRRAPPTGEFYECFSDDPSSEEPPERGNSGPECDRCAGRAPDDRIREAIDGLAPPEARVILLRLLGELG